MATYYNIDYLILQLALITKYDIIIYYSSALIIK